MKLLKYIFLFCIFIVGSCGVNTPDEEKHLFTQFVGRWKLVYSYYPSDSVLIYSSRITLQADSLFYCTTSVFWRDDSLKFHPSSGKWTVSDNGFTLGGTSLTLSLKIDTLTDLWNLKGGTQDSMMYWSTLLQGRMYSWKLDN